MDHHILGGVRRIIFNRIGGLTDAGNGPIAREIYRHRFPEPGAREGDPGGK